ncbi:PAS domain-containing protein [Myxococcota bacterium]|nr:PAS domain-containing protein [Myxococcota bacterium]
MALGVALFATAGAVLLERVDELRDHLELRGLEQKERQIHAALQALSKAAALQASAFAQQDAIVNALAQIRPEDRAQEHGPSAQVAREALRANLNQQIKGYEALTGQHLKLHIHFAHGEGDDLRVRSLLRSWRPRQVNRDGAWVDVSDDLTGFRQTLIDVNRTGLSQRGVELGRGGFVVRGVVPIRAPDFDPRRWRDLLPSMIDDLLYTPAPKALLGTLEVYFDFESVLAGGLQGAGDAAALYMNAEHLRVTTRLRDSSKHPVLEDAFVLTGIEDPGLGLREALSVGLLRQGQARLSVARRDGLTLGAFPVRDYRGVQIGVLVYAQDVKPLEALIARFTSALWLLGGVALLGLIALTAWLLLVFFRPIGRLSEHMQRISKAQQWAPYAAQRRDEIGALIEAFNAMITQIKASETESARLVGYLNTLTFPVVRMDADRRITYLNATAEALLGVRLEEIQARGARCHEVICADACNDERCPYKQMQGGMPPFDGETWASPQGARVPVRFGAIPVEDAEGGFDGFIEALADLRETYAVVEGVREGVTTLTGVAESAARKTEETASASALIVTEALKARSALEEITAQTHQARGASEDVNIQASAASAAIEEMNASLVEIASNITRAADAAGRVEHQAHQAQGLMETLDETAIAVGEIVSLINDIADRTNLLALNATIEAASAGAAGAGFAVVAREVKSLAQQTAEATKRIRQQVEAMQRGSGEARGAVVIAREGVEEVTALVQSLAAAVEEQTHAIAEVSASMSRTAQAIGEIEVSIGEVDQKTKAIHAQMERFGDASKQAEAASKETLKDIQGLRQLSQDLQARTDGFKLKAARA